MGWLYINNNIPVAEYVNKIWQGPETKPLLTKIVNFREAYTAVEHSSGYVFAGVTLLDYRPKEFLNLGTKEMDETCGPYYCNCPLDILNLLTVIPGDYPYSERWRQDCFRNIIKRRAKVKRSATVKEIVKKILKGIKNHPPYLTDLIVEYLTEVGMSKTLVLDALISNALEER